MNETERQLIDLLLDDALPEAERTNLLARLVGDAEAVAYLADRALLHSDLRQSLKRREVQQWVTASISPQVALPVTTTPRWFQWRPLTAAAAGLVIGLFSTSIVFAFIVQNGSETRTPLPLFDPGFENPKIMQTDGFHGGTGHWSGDAVQVVSAENGVSPKEGKFMLLLEPMKRGTPRIFQVLDLQTLTPDLRGDSQDIEISASFATAVAGASARFVIRAFAVAEAPESLDAGWFDLKEESIASSARGLDVTAEMTGWQTFGVKMQVPRAARSLVLYFGVRTPDKTARTSPSYLDDVQVSVLSRSISP